MIIMRVQTGGSVAVSSLGEFHPVRQNPVVHQADLGGGPTPGSHSER